MRITWVGLASDLYDFYDELQDEYSIFLIKFYEK